MVESSNLTLDALLQVANSNIEDRNYSPEAVANYMGFTTPIPCTAGDIGDMIISLQRKWEKWEWAQESDERKRAEALKKAAEDLKKAEALDFAVQTKDWGGLGLLNTARTVLKQIAERNRDIHNGQRVVSPNIYAGSSYLTIAVDGKATPVADPVLTLFSGIDTTRIRQCPICEKEKFFWAGRIKSKNGAGQSCCSKRCNNTRIKRESRSAEKKAQANARAKENRVYRKKIRDKEREPEEILTEEDWEKVKPRGRKYN